MPKQNPYLIENKKPVEEVRCIEEIQLPKLSEITDKDGKVKLPPELINKLLMDDILEIDKSKKPSKISDEESINKIVTDDIFSEKKDFDKQTQLENVLKKYLSR